MRVPNLERLVIVDIEVIIRLLNMNSIMNGVQSMVKMYHCEYHNNKEVIISSDELF
jgi:hypothetical protein